LKDEKALFTTKLRSKFRNCEKMDHMATDHKVRRDQQPRVETQVVCNYCKKPGNYKADCFKFLKKNQNLGIRNQRNCVASATTDIVLNAFNSLESFKNICIGDSKSSCH
jgi:hypothetical protein